MNRWLVLLAATPLLLAGCGAAELDPVTTARAGNYQIQLLAPGGKLQRGDNQVAVQAVRDGQPVAVKGGSLSFVMPPMGTMPAMQTTAKLSTIDNRLEGAVHFEMEGGWNGQVEVLTAEGPVRASLRVQVK